MPDLLIGCGSNHAKQLTHDDTKEWSELVTLDMNPDHKPDVLWDLCKLPLPFDVHHFDSIHAYEVLEHTGQQGDWKFFFDQWSDFWRILKPGGMFLGHSPLYSSPWAWGDPGHTRIITGEGLAFLCQPEYSKQVGKTAMTDYRFRYKADFDIGWHQTDQHVFFSLKAVKPSRCAKS